VCVCVRRRPVFSRASPSERPSLADGAGSMATPERAHRSAGALYGGGDDDDVSLASQIDVENLSRGCR
jgi:hypothetical protein